MRFKISSTIKTLIAKNNFANVHEKISESAWKKEEKKTFKEKLKHFVCLHFKRCALVIDRKAIMIINKCSFSDEKILMKFLTTFDDRIVDEVVQSCVWVACENWKQVDRDFLISLNMFEKWNTCCNNDVLQKILRLRLFVSLFSILLFVLTFSPYAILIYQNFRARLINYLLLLLCIK